MKLSADVNNEPVRVAGSTSNLPWITLAGNANANTTVVGKCYQLMPANKVQVQVQVQ